MITRRINILGVNFLALVIFSGIADAETGKTPDPGAVILGKGFYEKHCQVCHQKDGVGERPIPWSLRKPGYFTAMPLNETSHAWHHTDEQLANIILEGLQRTERMPAFSRILSAKEVDDIVAYIKSLWSPRIVACQGPQHMRCMQ